MRCRRLSECKKEAGDVCEKSELQTVIFCISSFCLRATHRVPRALPSTHRRLPRPNRPRRRSENPSPRHLRARAGPRAAPRAALRAAAAAARRASDSREGRWRRTTPSATRWWGAPSTSAAEAISLKMSSKMPSRRVTPDVVSARAHGSSKSARSTGAAPWSTPLGLLCLAFYHRDARLGGGAAARC